MISEERKHELVVEIGARRANAALDRTPDAVVYRLISGLDDIAPMPYIEQLRLAAELADLIRAGRAVFVRPQDYVGKGYGEPVQAETAKPLERGDRVRLTRQVDYCGPGCEGHIAAIEENELVHVIVDGFGLLICPQDALERIGV